jgi:chaperonin GroEL
MSRKYCSNEELQTKILQGVETLADNVATTLGPKGRNVILQEKGKRPIITKDGVTVAKFVEFEDHFMNAGAQVIKQAAEQTNSDAGDGTTTTTILCRAILQHAQRYITAGVSPVELKRGIDKAVAAVVTNLEDQSRPISSLEDINRIATISANGDEVIGNLVATAVDAAGKDGAITIQEARSVETSLDLVEGFRLASGWAASAFVTDERTATARYDKPLLLVTDEKIETVDQILPVLEVVAREGRPLVIFAEEVEGQALAALIMNTVRGTMKVAAVKAPRYGEERRGILQDLATSIGATFVSRLSGMRVSETKLSDLGSADKIEITRYMTTIMGGKGDVDEIDNRINTLKSLLEDNENLHDCERLQDRITKLASGVAVIRVGGATEIEMIERKHRIEDALEAVKSAQQEGIVAGGGTALVRASTNLEVEVTNEEQELGVEIVKGAIQEPLKQMATNAGASPDLTVSRILSSQNHEGWDFSTGKFVDLFDSGILDPAKVTRCALQNAASAAGTLLTANYAIVQDE